MLHGLHKYPAPRLCTTTATTSRSFSLLRTLTASRSGCVLMQLIGEAYQNAALNTVPVSRNSWARLVYTVGQCRLHVMKPIFHCIALGSWVIEVLNEWQAAFWRLSFYSQNTQESFWQGAAAACIGVTPCHHLTKAAKWQEAVKRSLRGINSLHSTPKFVAKKNSHVYTVIESYQCLKKIKHFRGFIDFITLRRCTESLADPSFFTAAKAALVPKTRETESWSWSFTCEPQLEIIGTQQIQQHTTTNIL